MHAGLVNACPCSMVSHLLMLLDSWDLMVVPLDLLSGGVSSIRRSWEGENSHPEMPCASLLPTPHMYDKTKQEKETGVRISDSI